MRSLDDKEVISATTKPNQRWLILSAALLLCLLALGTVCFACSKMDREDPEALQQPTKTAAPADTTVKEQTSGEETTPAAADTAQQQTESKSPQTTAPATGQTAAASTDTGSTGSEKPAGNAPSSTGSGSTAAPSSDSSAKSTTPSQTKPTDNATASTDTSGSKTTTESTPTAPGTDTSGSTTVPETEKTDPPATQSTPSDTAATVTYGYRAAKYGDDFSVSYNFPENAIVITDVTTPAANGEYIIPETIDGKPVVAIMGLAFSNSAVSATVKKVVVPASVKTIWGNAFANCYNLTDIYFRGTAIYTETYAFPEVSKRTGTLTIHCSATCSDRNLRYYKNSAVYYDAVYQEWNG